MRVTRILHLSTYAPRKCGVGEFAFSLTRSLIESDRVRVAVAAIDNWKTDPVDGYSEEVIYRIDQSSWADLAGLAKEINSDSDLDLVLVQHEYSIYPGQDGRKVVDFLKMLKKPVVTVFHTVLAKPTSSRREVTRQVARLSHSVVVINDAGRDILAGPVYEIPRSKIRAIPLGVPDFSFLNPLTSKKNLGLDGRVVMCSANLLSPTKGIEVAIRSLPKIIEKIPNFLYVVVGQTHPNSIFKYGGDLYRKKLERLVKNLKLERHVVFINRFVSQDELAEYVNACDIYVTPYMNPQQISSAGLTLAVGAGKVCVSTRFVHAQKLLSQGRGVLVDFKNHNQISDAVIHLFSRPEIRSKIQAKVWSLGQTMIWPRICAKYLHLFSKVKNKQMTSSKISRLGLVEGVKEPVQLN